MQRFRLGLSENNRIVVLCCLCAMFYLLDQRSGMAKLFNCKLNLLEYRQWKLEGIDTSSAGSGSLEPWRHSAIRLDGALSKLI